MGVRDVLNKISEVSPQSKLYSETLRAFADTINMYRRQSSHKARHTIDQYIDQILVIEVEQGDSGHTLAAQAPSVSQTSWGPDLGISDSLSSDDPTLIGLAELDDNWFSQQNWDNVPMQFLDNFSIDYGAHVM